MIIYSASNRYLLESNDQELTTSPKPDVFVRMRDEVLKAHPKGQSNQANAIGRGFDGNLYISDGLDITSSVRPGVVNTAPNSYSVQEVALQTNTYSVSTADGTQWSIRVDQNFKNERIYASYYNLVLNTLNAAGRSGFDLPNRQTSRSFQVSETHTFSPTLLNEAKFGYQPMEGLSGETGPINIAGQGTNIGASPAHQDFIQHNYHWRDTVSYVRGRHSVRMGFEGFHGDEFTLFGQQQSQPVFVFNNLLDLGRDAPFSESNVCYPPRARRRSSASAFRAPRMASLCKINGSHAATHAGPGFAFRLLRKSVPVVSVDIRYQQLPAGLRRNLHRTGREWRPQADQSGVRLNTEDLQPPRGRVVGSHGKSQVCGARWRWGLPRVVHQWRVDRAAAGQPAGLRQPDILLHTGHRPSFALGTNAVCPFNYPIPAVPAGVPDAHGGYSGFPTANIGGTDQS